MRWRAGRTAVILLFAFPVVAQVTGDKVLEKLCPPAPKATLTSNDWRVIKEVAVHYRKFQWTRDEGAAHHSYARHSVPSLKAPQVIRRETIPFHDSMRHALVLEMQRHGVGDKLRESLMGELASRNATSKSIDVGEPNLVGISCRELMSAIWLRKESALDLTNASVAISLMLPAFDKDGAHALIVAVNDVEYPLGGDAEPEVILLRRSGGAWRLEWHATLEMTRPNASPDRLRPEDAVVFETVVRALRGRGVKGKIRIVNQTRELPEWEIMPHGPTRILDRKSKPATDLLKRNAVSIFLNSLAVKHDMELVQREALDELDAEKVLSGAGALVWFSLPGYSESGTAYLIFDMVTPAGTGIERGLGVAQLQKGADGWAVAAFEYQRFSRTERAPR